jgi:hypothetical protein
MLLGLVGQRKLSLSGSRCMEAVVPIHPDVSPPRGRHLQAHLRPRPQRDHRLDAVEARTRLLDLVLHGALQHEVE